MKKLLMAAKLTVLSANAHDGPNLEFKVLKPELAPIAANEDDVGF